MKDMPGCILHTQWLSGIFPLSHPAVLSGWQAELGQEKFLVECVAWRLLLVPRLGAVGQTWSGALSPPLPTEWETDAWGRRHRVLKEQNQSTMKIDIVGKMRTLTDLDLHSLSCI